MNEYIIRKCRKEDIESIHNMQVNWQKEDITYGFVPCDREYLESKLGDYFYIGEIENKIIGFAYGTIHEAKDISVIEDGEKYIEIDDIYIIPEYRNTGIGGVLLDKVLETARDNSIEKSIVYSATKDSHRIVKFYENHGYKTWYVQMFK